MVRDSCIFASQDVQLGSVKMHGVTFTSHETYHAARLQTLNGCLKIADNGEFFQGDGRVHTDPPSPCRQWRRACRRCRQFRAVLRGRLRNARARTRPRTAAARICTAELPTCPRPHAPTTGTRAYVCTAIITSTDIVFLWQGVWQGVLQEWPGRLQRSDRSLPNGT